MPHGAAYHFAGVAAQAELEAQVRLAGDAVRVAQPELREVAEGSAEFIFVG